jgi:hypothetical protein
MDSLPKRVSSREQAAALIIVLAMVVLMTGLAVAYFSRATSDRPVAHSSFNQSKVDQLAQSAMDLIIGDLQQEITNGSSPTPSATPNITPLPLPTPTPFVYPPTNPANILPTRSGAPASIPNLVRRSIFSDPIVSPGVPSRASAVSSTQASANGRLVRLPRWNKHYLIPRPAGALPTDTTPISDFNAPDWVIVTRNGPVAFSSWNSSLADQSQSNDSYCVGRYSYAIYDEGGLLDANVVGYPSNTTAAQYGPKGVSAFADLTVLGMSQSDIDAIVGWRNYFSASPTGNFPSFNFNAAAATRYVASVLSNTNGFMSVAIPSPIPNNMSRTDQALTMRQSLINLLVASGLSANAVNALQYLGTFSRELNAPSWAPTQNASDMGGNNGVGNVYAYRTNADSSTAINRNVLGVFVQDQHTFTRADGTTTVVGELLINRRFPLTRIGGLGLSGPVTTGNPTTIVDGVPAVASLTTVQRDFGLLWNADNTAKRWDYVGASGSTVQSTIERLDQVAAEGREPNFFERLKAVILNGSVGLGSGAGNVRTFVAAEGKYYDTTNNLSSDYQIMQIGANIIDQWDSDNVPTFINFGNPANELAGIENLPYLNKLVFKPAWKKVQGKDQFEAWLLPSLWNPHQNAPGTGNVRIAMPTTGQSMTASITINVTPFTLTTTTPVTGSSTQFMTVDAGNFGTLTSPSAPTAVVGNPPSSITKSPDNYYGFNFPFATVTGVGPANSLTAYPDFGAGCDFELQVQVSTSPSLWKAYQRWKGCAQPAPKLFCQSPTSWTANTLQDPEFVTLDPRTLRFGGWGNAGIQSAVPADYTDGTQGTLDWPVPRFEKITKLPPQGTFFGSPTSTDLYKYASNVDGAVHYTDLDSVQRLGDFLTLGATSAMLPTNSTDRPLALSGAFQNGVFQSVAELGHIFRDQPWKTLNFTTAAPDATARSADAGLLDVFTLHESSMEAGKTSLNTKHALVLKAILSLATRRLTGANVISSTQRDNIVTALQNLITAQPLINKAELITRLAADASVTGLGNKEARECVIRAFTDAGQTRTWNLMIDVIAQSGRYAPGETDLAKFNVEGEQHYWVHVAVDRFTGQVIDKEIEVVNE